MFASLMSRAMPILLSFNLDQQANQILKSDRYIGQNNVAIQSTARIPRNPRTNQSKRHIIAADRVAVRRLFVRLAASKGWNALTAEEQGAIKAREEMNLMQKR